MAAAYKRVESKRDETKSLHNFIMNLHQGSREGRLKEVRLAIDDIFAEIPDKSSHKFALSAHDANHLSALHYAVKYNHIDIVRLLLEKGADVNVVGRNGAQPIHYATLYMREEDDCSILQVLLHYKANINAIDEKGLTPLHYACHKGNWKMVKELLESKGINAQARDKLKSTPLHCACASGSLEIVELLLEKDVEILADDDGGMSPLHIACSQGHKGLLEYLLQAVEDNAGYSGVAKTIDHQNNEGQTLLHLAAASSHIDIVKFLLERGSDVTLCQEGDETVLHLTAVTGNRELMKILVAHGGEVNRKNAMGRTALHKAARFGKYKVVDLLLKHNADINARDAKRLTPLLLASSNSGNPETITRLIKNGANVLARNTEDQTALHIAVIDNNINNVQALLTSSNATSIIDSKDKDSNTCLHIACANGYEEIAILLLQAKADVKSRNNEEKTPLHLAAYYGQDDVVDNIIEKKPSTINDFDHDGNSPLHLAAIQGNTEVIKYLLQCGAAVNDKNTKSMTPLDCAATSGKTEAIKILIWGGASLYPSDETGLGPLHRSCIEGHVEATRYLLDYCDIGFTDKHGRNPLDLCIDHNRYDTAQVLLEHRDWKVALRNKSIEDKRVTTPLRKMIVRMPELALYTLDRCVHSSGEHAADHQDFNISLTYEFVDDVYHEWHCDIVREDTEEGKGTGALFTNKKLERQMEKKKAHILYYMVEHERQELLSHPLTLALINSKWMKFAFFIYYFKLLLYILFLTFITGYVLVSAPLRLPYRDEHCTINKKLDTVTWELAIFVYFGKVAVLVLALIHILFEIAQIFSQRLDYLAWDNLIEWSVYLLAIANVIDDFVELPLKSAGVLCGTYQKTAGAICIFLAWLNFILFIQKVPFVGIYIVMFLYVVTTFFKFFIVFVFLIIMFAFSFFVLLHDESSIASFKTPWSALIKTGVMMTGELGFDDFFYQDSVSPLPATWLLFTLFIIVMVIILMNLLVGLAVDDIRAVQRKAEMTKSTMQIEICLDSEKILPKSIRKKFVPEDTTIYPNRRDGVPRYIGSTVKDKLLELVTREKDVVDELQSSLQTMQKNLMMIRKKVAKMDEQLADASASGNKINEVKSMVSELLKIQQRRKSRRSGSPSKHAETKGDTTVERLSDGEQGDDERGR